MTRMWMRSSGQRWLMLATVGAVALAGCRHGSEREEKRGETRCAESRNLTCVTGVNCTMDRERGCEVCRCSTASGLEPTDNRRPAAMEPERRW